MIHVYYQDDDYDLIDITPHVNLSDRNLTVTCQAEQGSVGTAQFVIDDPDAQLYISGHRLVHIIEDEAPTENQLVWWGYTADRDVQRLDAPVGTYRRKWTPRLVDINSLIERKVMAGEDTDRPEETDVERIQWLMTTGEAGFFDDTITFIDTSSPVDMDAVNYNGQMFKSIVDDCAQQSGKNYYIRWLWSAGPADYRAAVWYGHDNVTLAESDLQISNVLGDVDYATTWLASEDSRLNYDPSRVYSGVFGNYDGGYTYRTRFDTIDEFANRDTTASWPNVKTLTKAQARGDLLLDTLHTEEEVITTSILVPPANVNDAMAGDMITVKYSHLPGYGLFREARILNRTVTFVTPEFYQIDYELTPMPEPIIEENLLIAFINVGGPGSLNEPADLSTNAWTKAFWTGSYKSFTQFPGPGGPGSFGIWYRQVVPGESASVITVGGQSSQATSVWVYQVSGASSQNLISTSGVDTVPWVLDGEVTLDSPEAEIDSVFIGGWALQKVSYGEYTVLNNSTGTGLGDVTGANTPTAGNCGVGDGAPPTVHLGYNTGTGVLTIGSTFECCGSGPGCYNHYGRGKGGLLLPLAGTFGIVQEDFGVAVSADVTVTLPSAP